MFLSYCSCHAGWTGPNCTQCQPRVDCKYGTCEEHPFECKCFSKYNGSACDKPTCREGCHPEHVINLYLLEILVLFHSFNTILTSLDITDKIVITLIPFEHQGILYITWDVYLSPRMERSKLWHLCTLLGLSGLLWKRSMGMYLSGWKNGSWLQRWGWRWYVNCFWFH